jgi:hypothetical protein
MRISLVPALMTLALFGLATCAYLMPPMPELKNSCLPEHRCEAL